jgi:hypothetical protein
MSTSTSTSNLRVFVQWTEQTVFAGEDIECQITFKNIATKSAPSTSLHPQSANGFPPERQRKGASPLLKSSSLSSRPNPPNRGHRTTLSLNAPGGVGRLQTASGSGPWNGGYNQTVDESSTHKHSISIISIGPSESTVDNNTIHNNFAEGSRRTSRGHGRSASLQIVPRRHANGGPSSGESLLKNKSRLLTL